MYRYQESRLTFWFTKKKRKPLVIRGARQVGKTSVVRNFAEANKIELVEINLEKKPELDKVFKSLNIYRFSIQDDALKLERN
jgi:predicted AAA+ superfamily ATPase